MQDESCHWYLVGLDQRDGFRRLINDAAMAEDAGNFELSAVKNNQFEDTFGECRIDGGPYGMSFENPEAIDD